MLDTRLQQRQARETGICPVRRQLYTQCFDELIRQVRFTLTNLYTEYLNSTVLNAVSEARSHTYWSVPQVTINCGERGLLLLRVRDEARITMEAYQTLYCSSIAFGMRKALQVRDQYCILSRHHFIIRGYQPRDYESLVELRQCNNVMQCNALFRW